MKPLSSYMKPILRHTVLSVALSAAAVLLPLAGHAEIKELVTPTNITASTQFDGNHSPSNLWYDNDNKYHTWDDNDPNYPNRNFDEPQYLEVNLGDNWTIGDNEDLIVFVQRCHNCIVRQPTAFRVEGYVGNTETNTEDNSEEESEVKPGTEEGWEQICHIYFLYRGRSTKEYSARFHPKKNYSKLRFYVTENNSRNYDKYGHRSMGLRQFQVYQVPRTETTVGGRIDPVHLDTDYKKDYYYYKFEHTMGWLNDRNRDKSKTSENKPCWYDFDINHEAHTKGEKTWQETYVQGIIDWATWENAWNLETGKWKLDNKKLEEFGITMPDMGLITKDVDFTATEEDEGRQATHEMEHILYAVPGDPIILYPYYKFANAKHYEKYEVNFAHWYDYRTGGRIIYDDKKGNTMDLLDFIVDPSQICITEKNGFYGGYLLTEKNTIIPELDSKNYGMFATFFCPRNPLDDKGDVKTLPFRDIDIASGTNDVNEYVIAADFSQSFNKGRNLVTNPDGTGKIIEPNISFRHIFRIRDGKEFADKFSGSAKLNKDYIAQNSRQVTARSGEEFQIGLDGGIPIPIQDGSWWRCAPSKYYYKVSNTDYRRVLCMGIRVLDSNGTKIAEYFHTKENKDKPYDSSNLFYFDTEEFPVGEEKDKPEFTGLGHRTDGVYYGVGGGSVVEGEYWKYSRLLKTKNKDLKGKYTVQLIGEEIIGENAPTPIKVFGSDTEELIVLEYVIDFVESPQAFVITGDKLYKEKNNNNDDAKIFNENGENIYKFAREEELISKYGEPKDKIDFDQYRYLETLSNKNEYLKEGKVEGQYRFKWPASWEKSNYGFGYAEGHNYNMYTVANHSNMTQYHNYWADDKNKWEVAPNNEGLEDILYWKTKKWSTQSNQTTRAEEENYNGYFLYVNAANDPGVMITLNAGKLCTGSTINVSAWVAEFSHQPERANLAFNLVAVLAGTGERLNIHTFVSGYVPEVGQWCKIFYSFQPDVDRIGLSSALIDHYELELENNCKSSDGADYAIDEISIYIVTPEFGAEQEIPICLDVDAATDHTVKVFAPFGPTLRSSDVTESTTATGKKDVRLSYVVLDKAKFDEAYYAAKENNSADAGAEAFTADGVRVGEGSVTFSSCYNEIPEFSQQTALNTVGRYLDEQETRMIAFKVDFKDADFAIGKEYYIALYAQKDGDGIVPNWNQYDLTDPCAKACKFKVAAKNSIRLDGEVREQTGPLKVCEGEKPVISIDLKTVGASDDTYIQGARCDWFKGTKEAFDAIEDEDGLTLYKAMTYFREAYPEATGPEDESVEANDNFFTQAMLKLITDNKDKFVFYATKYEFDRLEKGTAEVVVTALPIPYQDANKNDQTVCTSPMEIKIEVVAKAPSILHGLRGVDYPEKMDDVPLRVGLDQLSSVSVKKDEALSDNQMMLVVPIRKVETSGVVEKVESLSSVESGIVVFESTNDPNEDLQPETVTASSGDTYSVKPDIEAGVIKNFTAATAAGSKNEFSILFYDSFPFKEGYEYTFSYQFKEDMPEGEDHVCQGKDLFTIKVVPEFMVWTPGKDNRNWNNDGNWKRVSSEALLADADDSAAMTRLHDKVTDGSNSNTSAYVPMDFTKVIIPDNATAEAPYMYDFKGIDGETVVPTQSGDATENIEYDMVANETESNIECELWYANTCDQIHFLPEASIMNQQYLEYNRAWVDLELTPSRWYTLAMPLKKVFAGEFYLPTADARQGTELFQEITYDTNLNDRFNPAVFQRGWDKGQALIYHPDKSTTSAVVKANWSHVYNDVEESYGSGVGFSIKADVSHVENASDKVLFRLPKADTEYGYYDYEGKELEEANRKPINHGTDHYQLNEGKGTIKAENVGNKYFLVGNPFMTHLDMKAFLEANSGLVQQKYWMITEGSQKMGVFDPDSEGLVGNAEGTVAPMQGFFVEAISETNSLELSYDESMMHDGSATAGSSPLKIASRGYDEGFMLTISALNDDEESTAAVVRVSPDASSAYVAEEDMVVIDNSDLEVRSTVYTVSDGKALSVNSLEAIGNAELGLIALPQEKTTLRFNTDTDCALNLFDAETGAYTPIFDGMTYPVSGNAAGRLYLTATNGVKSIEASTITWSTTGDELTVRSSDAACPRLSVRVIDYAGRIVAAQSVEGSEVRMPIAAGVYVLEAETDTERVCVQVKL